MLIIMPEKPSRIKACTECRQQKVSEHFIRIIRNQVATQQPVVDNRFAAMRIKTTHSHVLDVGTLASIV